MRRTQTWCRFCVAVALGYASAAVTPTAFGEEIPGEVTGVRPIGMGDAFTAVANDENAVWYNPAGIGRSRKARSRSTFNLTTFPNLIVGANADTHNFYDAFQGSQDKSVAGVLTNDNNIAGKPLYARGAIAPLTEFDLNRNTPIAFGVYSNTTVQALVPTNTPDTAHVSAISDAGVLATIGYSDDANRLNFGFTARPVVRYAYEDYIPSSDLVSKTAMTDHLKEESNKSQGLGLDVGGLYTIADFWYPTIGFAILNLPTGCKKGYLNPYTQKLETVCGDLYHGNIANADALSVVDPTDARVGISITPRLTRTVNLRFALDIHHIPIGTPQASYGLQGIEASKLVHGGVELFFGNPLLVPAFSVRAGYSQGFFTSGISTNLGIVDLEFATYGVDVSNTSTPVEDRRYLASLSVGI